MGLDASQNDVWSTLKSLGSEALGAARDIAISRNARTTAAPSGNVGGTVWNPFPGTQSAYPQAEAKPLPGGSVFNLGNLSPALILGGLVLLVIALIARR